MWFRITQRRKGLDKNWLMWLGKHNGEFEVPSTGAKAWTTTHRCGSVAHSEELKFS